jgi:hypothetical protein
MNRAVFLWLLCGPAFAHDGHGAPTIHLHWWEYGIVLAVVVGLATWLSRR